MNEQRSNFEQGCALLGRVLIAFLVPATLIFHNYWAADAAQVMNQSNHFFKNVAILGTLVFLLGVGAGPASIDNRRRY